MDLGLINTWHNKLDNRTKQAWKNNLLVDIQKGLAKRKQLGAMI